jgi:hypothetical protein
VSLASRVRDEGMLYKNVGVRKYTTKVALTLSVM